MDVSLTIIATFILLTAFLLILQSRIHNMIITLIWQSILLATATFLSAIKNNAFELYISTILTISLKTILIPYLLHRLIIKLHIRRKVANIKHPFLLLLVATSLVLFCYYLFTPNNNTIAIAMAVMLLGMLLLITHHKAISHIIGFMTMENGIFLAALITTQGMPMVVELGIAFDVLVAAILFGAFFFQMRRSIDSLDVDRLNLLREDIE